MEKKGENKDEHESEIDEGLSRDGEAAEQAEELSPAEESDQEASDEEVEERTD